MFYPVVVTVSTYATAWRYRMDFIEKVFGVSPDGGSEAFEVLVFLIPIVGLYLLYQRLSCFLGDSARSTGPN